jgi:hypothetical protein
MRRRRIDPLSPVKLVVSFLSTFVLLLLFGFSTSWLVTLLIGAVGSALGWLAADVYEALRSPTGPETAERIRDERTEAFLETLDQPNAPVVGEPTTTSIS